MHAHLNVKLIVGFVGLTFCWSMVAEARSPVGTGNYRRREAIKAAFKTQGHDSRPGRHFRVKGINTVLNHSYKWSRIQDKLPKNARILAVSNRKTGKVVLVKAPTDRRKRVHKLTTKDANRYGLINQQQAQKLASRNGGIYGDKSAVRVIPKGISRHGHSFAFKQISHLKTTTNWDNRQSLQTVSRHVPMTGQAGETAVGGGFWTSQTVGTKIRHARGQGRGNMSQAELGRKLGVSAATVNAWERNHKPVPQNKLPTVLKELGRWL